MPAFIKENLDYCIFAFIVVAAFSGLQLGVWKRHHRPSVTLAAWLIVLGALAGTWFTVDYAGKRQYQNLQEQTGREGPAYANELMALQHEKVRDHVKPERMDPNGEDFKRYAALLKVGKLLCDTNRASIKNICTLRKGEAGKYHIILNVNADARILGQMSDPPEEAPPAGITTTLGNVFEEHADALKTAFTPPLGPVYSEKIQDKKEGAVATVFHPLFSATGRMEAVLGIDYDASKWQESIANARLVCFAMFGGFILLVFIFSTVASMVVLTQQNVDQLRHSKKLETARHRFETLVNSIEGIVWEYDPETLRYLYVSAQSETILGWPRAYWLSNEEFRIAHVHEADRAGMLEVICHAVSHGQPYTCVFRMLSADNRIVWLRESGAVVTEGPGTREDGRTRIVRGISTDITSQKLAEFELDTTHKRLLVTSRQAGMAEVATGVLHNVGNVLNSVNVSVTLMQDRLLRSRLPSLFKATQLLEENHAGLADYLSTDPKGVLLPDFLSKLTAHLQEEQGAIYKEVECLVSNVEHIRDIVSAQQNHATMLGQVEPLLLADLADLAVRLNESLIERSKVQITRDYHPSPPAFVDKHKVLQILINLLSNAVQACDMDPKPVKMLVISIESTETMVRLTIGDNGVGIAPGDLTKIFSLGFTTKEHGHGFGLHSGAIAAQEMGGSLAAQSDGPGAGAVFTLELPLKPHSNRNLARYAITALSPAHH